MSYSDAYVSVDSSNENSNATEANELDEMLEEMEVSCQVEPYGLLYISYFGYYLQLEVP